MNGCGLYKHDVEIYAFLQSAFWLVLCIVLNCLRGNPDWEADTQAFQAGNYFMAGNFYTRHGQGNRSKNMSCGRWSSSINNLGSLGSNPILIGNLGFVGETIQSRIALPLFDDFTWYFLGFCLGFWDKNAFVKASTAQLFFPSLVLVFMVSLATFAGFPWYFTVFYIHFLVLYPDLPRFFSIFPRWFEDHGETNEMVQAAADASNRWWIWYGLWMFFWMFMIYTCTYYMYISTTIVIMS